MNTEYHHQNAAGRTIVPTKPCPRHEALRLARKARSQMSQVMPTLTEGGATAAMVLLWTALTATLDGLEALAEECEALNRSKAEDSHGH